MARPDAADIHDVRNFFKGGAEIVEGSAIADIDGPTALQTQIVDVLRETQQPVELHCPRRPTRNRSSQLLQNGERALAPPEPHGVCDLAAGNENSFADLRPRRLHPGRLPDVV